MEFLMCTCHGESETPGRGKRLFLFYVIICDIVVFSPKVWRCMRHTPSLSVLRELLVPWEYLMGVSLYQFHRN